MFIVRKKQLARKSLDDNVIESSGGGATTRPMPLLLELDDMAIPDAGRGFEKWLHFSHLDLQGL
jgi:hypothetical protein